MSAWSAYEERSILLEEEITELEPIACSADLHPKIKNSLKLTCCPKMYVFVHYSDMIKYKHIEYTIQLSIVILIF